MVSALNITNFVFSRTNFPTSSYLLTNSIFLCRAHTFCFTNLPLSKSGWQIMFKGFVWMVTFWKLAWHNLQLTKFLKEQYFWKWTSSNRYLVSKSSLWCFLPLPWDFYNQSESMFFAYWRAMSSTLAVQYPAVYQSGICQTEGSNKFDVFFCTVLLLFIWYITIFFNLNLLLYQKYILLYFW